MFRSDGAISQRALPVLIKQGSSLDFMGTVGGAR